MKTLHWPCLAALLAALALGACNRSGGEPAAGHGSGAKVSVAPTSGNSVKGELKLSATAAGVTISGKLEGLKPGGVNAFHVHEKGDCSAGAHLNPDGKPHGSMTAPEHHAGDMPNVIADEQGRAMVDVTVPGLEIGSGGSKDVIGKALVLHADPDDYTSQPAGNAGARIACGVIEKA